jgi:hypothetical protein
MYHPLSNEAKLNGSLESIDFYADSLKYKPTTGWRGYIELTERKHYNN